MPPILRWRSIRQQAVVAFRADRRPAGIAWPPNSKTVVRSGLGIFYNQEIGNAYFDLARHIGGSGTTANVPSPFAYAMEPKHHTSYALQYLLNIQRQLTPNLGAGGGRRVLLGQGRAARPGGATLVLLEGHAQVAAL